MRARRPPRRAGRVLADRERYFRWLLAHRWTVLTVCAAVIGLSVVGAARARVDYTIEQLFPTSGAARAAFEEYRAAFPEEDVRFSLVWEPAGEPDVQLFRDLERVAADFEAVGLRDVHWLGSIRIAEATDLDGEPGVRVHQLIEEDRLSDTYVRKTLTRHRNDNLYRNYLWNSDQSAFAVHGYLPDDRRDDVERREIEEALALRLANLDGDRATFALGGIPIIRSRLPKLLEADQRVLLGGGLILFFLLLSFFFRSPTQVAFCLVSALPAYVLTIGLMGWLGISVSVLTSFVPIIVLVVGVSDSIHLLGRFRAERGDGQAGSDAIVRAFAALTSSCFYTSLTTAVGFLSLLATRIGIVMEFGAFTAIAIASAFLFSMTLLPVLLSFRAETTFDDRGLRQPWLRRVVDVAVRHAEVGSSRVLAAFLLMVVVAVGASRHVRTNTLLLDDLRPRSQLLRDLRWIESKGFGLFQVVLSLKADAGEDLHDPRALAWMQRFQRFAETEPLVFGTLGIPDFLTQLKGAFDGGGPGVGTTLPETTEEATQLLLMAELEAADFLELVYHPEDREAQIIVSVRDQGSTVILPFLDRIDRYLSNDPPPVGTAVPTGTVYLLQSYQARILESFVPTIAIAVVLITAILMYMFRSVTFGLLALLPNLFPLVVLSGVMGMFSFDLKPSTILVFSIAFGIAADDTIHLLSRIRDELAAGNPVREALAISLRQVGPALVITTLVVAAGFSLLIGSQFEVLFLVGLMTAVSAVAALGADLFGLPAILRLATPRLEDRSTTRKRVFTISLVFTLLYPGGVMSQSAQERGKAIAVEANRRARGYGDLKARLTMSLRNRHGEERLRELRIQVLEGEGSKDRTMLVFDRPRDLQGTAFLTHANPDGPDSRWLFLPALRRVKRIGSSQQSDAFLGSEFSYEDIAPPDPDKYTYRFVEPSVLSGVDCWTVERFPEDSGSGYSRHVVWFDREAYRIRRIEYYDRDGELLKSLEQDGFRLHAQRFWRPDRMEMRNHRTGKTTRVEWSDIHIGVGLTKRDFDPSRLGRM